MISFIALILSDKSSNIFFSLSIVSVKADASDLFFKIRCVNSAFLILFCSRSVLYFCSSVLISDASLMAASFLFSHNAIFFSISAILKAVSLDISLLMLCSDMIFSFFNSLSFFWLSYFSISSFKDTSFFFKSSVCSL